MVFESDSIQGSFVKICIVLTHFPGHTSYPVHDIITARHYCSTDRYHVLVHRIQTNIQYNIPLFSIKAIEVAT